MASRFAKELLGAFVVNGYITSATALELKTAATLIDTHLKDIREGLAKVLMHPPLYNWRRLPETKNGILYEELANLYESLEVKE